MSDITMQEVLLLVGACAVPSILAYVLGRRCSRWWIGLLVALLWIPALLLFCPVAARAAVVGSYLWALIPTILCFVYGRWRRLVEIADRNA
jgi:hypothetical protein